jgi:hypothetical protein
MISEECHKVIISKLWELFFQQTFQFYRMLAFILESNWDSLIRITHETEKKLKCVLIPWLLFLNASLIQIAMCVIEISTNKFTIDTLTERRKIIFKLFRDNLIACFFNSCYGNSVDNRCLSSVSLEKFKKIKTNFVQFELLKL